MSHNACDGPASPTCLADLPELAGDDARPKSRITLFKLGKFKHPRFGRWHITRETFDAFLRNFAGRPAPIDFDHAPERQSGSTEAAGWITRLEVVGDELKADIEWTPIGASAIREARYKYISPTWSFAARDSRGQPVGPKVIGAGLTNRPFFEELPALALTADVQGTRALPEEQAAVAEERAERLANQLATGQIDYAAAEAEAASLLLGDGAYAWASDVRHGPSQHDQVDALGERLYALWASGGVSDEEALQLADAMAYAEPEKREMVSEPRQREQLAQKALELAEDGKLTDEQLERMAESLAYPGKV